VRLAAREIKSAKFASLDGDQVELAIKDRPEEGEQVELKIEPKKDFPSK